MDDSLACRAKCSMHNSRDMSIKREGFLQTDGRRRAVSLSDPLAMYMDSWLESSPTRLTHCASNGGPAA